MSEPFTVHANAIQSAIEILMPYSYSQEMMCSLGWNVDNAEDPLMFDISMAIIMLGGTLMCRKDFKGFN